MKGKITAIVLCSLLLGLVIFLPAATAQQPVPEPTMGPLSFAPRFAGTYVAETDFFFGPDEPLMYAFHTLSADGTMTGTNTNCCGRGGGGGLQGPVHGVWEKTGSREATLTAYGFAFNPDGTLFLTARITEVLSFDQDYETAEAVATTDLWFGTAVPDFDVDPPMMVVGPWPDSWTRLHVVVE